MMARVLMLWRMLSGVASAPRDPATPRRVTSRRHSARLAVWSGFATFIIATVALAVRIETSPTLRDPEFGHRLEQIRSWQATAPDRPLVLIVGSSRTQMGVSPAAMDFPSKPGSPLAYNAGLMGATPVGIRFQLVRTLDAGIRPDFVIAELFVSNLGLDSAVDNQRWARPGRFSLTDLGHLGDYMEDPDALPLRWAGERATPWYSHRLPLMSNWFPTWIPHRPREQFHWMTMDEFGFNANPQAGTTPAARQRMRDRARDNALRAIADFQPGEMPMRAFRGMAERCRAEGIPFAIFRTPESPQFKSWYGPGSRERAEAAVAALSAELGVPVFPAPDLPEGDFADGHHLLPHGAAKYSRWLADTHLKPWLAQHTEGGAK